MIIDYLLPETIEAALDIMSRHSGQCKIFAGGTILLSDGRERASEPDYYIGLDRIPGLSKIFVEDNHLFIGANITLIQCAENPLVQEHFPALSKVSGNIISTQIRNIATLAGNLVNAKPYSDMITVLSALRGVCVIESRQGKREVSVENWVERIGVPAIDKSSEILSMVKIPLRRPGEGSDYQRLQFRQAISYPVMCVAADLLLENGHIADACLVVSPAMPGPQRLKEVEAFLVGSKPEESIFLQAGQLASEHIRFFSSPLRCNAKYPETCVYESCRYCVDPVHASKEYRQQVLPVLVKRALDGALASISDE